MNQRERAEQLARQASNFRNNGEEQAAIEKYKEAVEIFLEVGDKQNAAECEHMMGVSYTIENDTDHALETLQKAAKIYGELGDTMDTGRVYRDLGLAYARRKDQEAALEWFEKSEVTLRDSGAKAELGITQAKIGLHYLEVKNTIRLNSGSLKASPPFVKTNGIGFTR